MPFLFNEKIYHCKSIVCNTILTTKATVSKDPKKLAHYNSETAGETISLFQPWAAINLPHDKVAS